MQEIFSLIEQEYQRQKTGLELIASENYVSDNVMKASGSILTNKYAEGYPGKRYYGGCEVVDKIESIAIDNLKKLFNADYANVQPHSGSQANAAVFLACLKPGDTILGFDLAHGGHLTHGSPVNFSGKTYHVVSYGVRAEDELIDYADIETKAKEHRPKIIIAGASSYSRDIDYKRIRTIADEVGALVLADIAHPAGLIATGFLTNAVEHCHIVTSTTHKTLRGPRGGVILMGKDFENPLGETKKDGTPHMMSHLLNMAVFPGSQGGPLEHTIAAKAIAFEEALSPEFKTYQKQVLTNAQTLANTLKNMGYKIVSNGTDNHCILMDLRNKNITGKDAEQALVAAHITPNKNMVPFDDKSPFVTSGIRIGTAAITTRGLVDDDMTMVAEFIDHALSKKDNETELTSLKSDVTTFMQDRPIFAW